MRKEFAVAGKKAIALSNYSPRMQFDLARPNENRQCLKCLFWNVFFCASTFVEGALYPSDK